MNVYIVRHAWAEEPNEARWPDDSLRPLTKEGRAKFRRVARRLGRFGVAPRVVVSSPFLRCVETAEILVSSWQEPMVLETVPFLAPQGDIHQLIEWTRMRMGQLSGDIAWVGHAPDVSKILATLIGGGTFHFAKAGIAAVQFKGPIAAGEGTLLFLIPPSLLL